MNNKSRRTALTLITVLFFMWGFITCLNDILIPYLKSVFELSNFQANLVQFAFFGAYFVGSFIYFIVSTKIGDPIQKIGYKKGIVIGLILSGIGCGLFIPASSYHSFEFFLSALFVIGLGFTILQIAANPYVTLLGSSDTASSRLNLAQGFNSLGTTLAPVIGGVLIFSFFSTQESINSDAVQGPYLGLMCILFILAIVFIYIPLPHFRSKDIKPGIQALRFPSLTLGAIAIFCYVGAEVAVGSNLVAYLNLPSTMEANEVLAAKLLSFYWGGAMIGRFLGALSLSNLEKLHKYLYMAVAAMLGVLLIYLINDFTWKQVMYYVGFLILNYLFFIVGKFIPSTTLGTFAVVNVLLLTIGGWIGGNIGSWCLLSIGLFNSIMWSNIFSLAIEELGEYTSQGSSLLIMMIVGGALIPPLQGYFADIIGIQHSYFILIIPYIYVAFYGWYLYFRRQRLTQPVRV